MLPDTLATTILRRQQPTDEPEIHATELWPCQSRRLLVHLVVSRCVRPSWPLLAELFHAVSSLAATSLVILILMRMVFVIAYALITKSFFTHLRVLRSLHVLRTWLATLSVVVRGSVMVSKGQRFPPETFPCSEFRQQKGTEKVRIPARMR